MARMRKRDDADCQASRSTRRRVAAARGVVLCAGAIGSPPAVINAVLDALAPLGVKELDMPASPSRVWEAIRAAQK